MDRSNEVVVTKGSWFSDRVPLEGEVWYANMPTPPMGLQHTTGKFLMYEFLDVTFNVQGLNNAINNASIYVFYLIDSHTAVYGSSLQLGNPGVFYSTASGMSHMDTLYYSGELYGKQHNAMYLYDRPRIALYTSSEFVYAYAASVMARWKPVQINAQQWTRFRAQLQPEDPADDVVIWNELKPFDPTE